MSNGQNTAAAISALNVAASLSAGQAPTLNDLLPAAQAVATATGKALPDSGQVALTLAALQAALALRDKLASGLTQEQAWADAVEHVAQAVAAWDAAPGPQA